MNDQVSPNSDELFVGKTLNISSTPKRQPEDQKQALISDSATTTLSSSAEQQQQNLGYQLRALNQKAPESNDNRDTPTFLKLSEKNLANSDELNFPKLSPELVNETLNYFVNCRQRLSQMTKTYDDSDAYLLLLQEKEVDLELAARIGQDLLKQNKQLKDSVKQLESELAQRQDDVQQLKYELASKITLLDTFIDEEEQSQVEDQSGRSTLLREESEDLFPSSISSINPHQIKTSQSANNFQKSSNSNISSLHRDHDEPSGFLSLNAQEKPTFGCFDADPFTSLPYQVNSDVVNSSDGATHHTNDDNGVKEPIDTQKSIKSDNSSSRTHLLAESVTLQLVESNKRLCELQDELIFKGEQSLLQQERIYRLEQQVRDSDRRLDDIATENESLRKSLIEAAQIQHALGEELKVCKRNFSELLPAFLELQKESRLNRNLHQQNQTSLASYYNELDALNDLNNISFDSYADTLGRSISTDQHSSDSSDSGADSGMHTTINTTTTATTLNLDPITDPSRTTDTDSDDNTSRSQHLQMHQTKLSTRKSNTPLAHSSNKKTSQSNVKEPSTITEASTTKEQQQSTKTSLLGLSSFMITTMILICLSASFNTPVNTNIAQKLQQTMRLDKFT